MTEGCLRTHCISPEGSNRSVSFVVPMLVRKQSRDIGHVHGHLSCTTCAVSDLGLAWPRSWDGYLSSPKGVHVRGRIVVGHAGHKWCVDAGIVCFRTGGKRTAIVCDIVLSYFDSLSELWTLD